LRRIGTLIQEPRKLYGSLPALHSTAESDSDSEYESSTRYYSIQDTSMDDKFETFVRICNKISFEASDAAKTDILKEFITKGSDGRGFKGDLKLFIRMLLPNYKQQMLDLNTTKLIQIFSFIFRTNYDDMMITLFHKKGDIAKTIRVYFRLSNNIQPARRSKLTLRDVDRYLNDLSVVSIEEDQIDILTDIAANSTLSELEMIIRLIKKDLRINMVIKLILNALALNGYAAFGMSGNLDDIIQRAHKVIKSDGKPGVIWMKQGHKKVRHEMFKNGK
jgi:DNA ligase-3